MNESITRAAGAVHGQEMTVEDMRSLANSLGRVLFGGPRFMSRTPVSGYCDAANVKHSPFVEA